MDNTKENVGKLLDKLKPVVRDATNSVSEAGQKKIREYASRSVSASREIISETEELSGDERKKKMKTLVLQRIGGPFPVRWALSSLVESIVGIAVDFEDVRGCVRDSSSSPESRKEASSIILKRLRAPFYLRWAARPIVGCALDIATEYSYLLNFIKSSEISGAQELRAETEDEKAESAEEGMITS